MIFGEPAAEFDNGLSVLDTAVVCEENGVGIAQGLEVEISLVFPAFSRDGIKYVALETQIHSGGSISEREKGYVVRPGVVVLYDLLAFTAAQINDLKSWTISCIVSVIGLGATI